VAPEVFITYSWDSHEHKERVRYLADKLNNQGVDCELDQYVKGTPDHGWPAWCKMMIAGSKYVLVVWTKTYLERYEAEAPAGVGRGAKWEGGIITQHVYDEEGAKFVPVVFEHSDKQYIAKEHARHTIYDLSSKDGFEALYRYLTDQPKITKPPLGKRILLESTPTAAPASSPTGPACQPVSELEAAEREIALQALRGRNKILKLDVDSGTHVNVNGYSYDDSEEQRQLFLEALESLERKKIARYEGGLLYELTHTGLQFAREVEETEEESDVWMSAKSLLKASLEKQVIETTQTKDAQLCVSINSQQFGRDDEQRLVFLEALRRLIRGGYAEPDFQPGPMKYNLTFRGRQEAKRVLGLIP